MKRILCLILFLPLIFLIGCGSEKPDDNSSNDSGSKVATYEQISQTQAKQLMDTEKDYIILDVRTQQEYDEGHIKGAILIPDYEIKTRAEKELPNKAGLILVYCRSGNRSKKAAGELANLGYTNVKEFGGINTWTYGQTRD